MKGESAVSGNLSQTRREKMLRKNIWDVASKLSSRKLHAALLMLLIVGGLNSIHRTQAQGTEFGEESIRGQWGFSAHGTIVPPAAPTPVPAVAIGIMTFNRDGSCSISDTININGSSASRTSFACTFTVNPDGTGSLEASFPGDPGPTPLAFVIVDHKSEIRFIRTDLGVASGVAKPM
jgi:hypothetical protein